MILSGRRLLRLVTRMGGFRCHSATREHESAHGFAAWYQPQAVHCLSCHSPCCTVHHIVSRSFLLLPPPLSSAAVSSKTSWRLARIQFREAICAHLAQRPRRWSPKKDACEVQHRNGGIQTETLGGERAATGELTLIAFCAQYHLSIPSRV